ncbi:hypothetical protein cypCar_00037678, partial [Cyprinus carpio]
MRSTTATVLPGLTHLSDGESNRGKSDVPWDSLLLCHSSRLLTAPAVPSSVPRDWRLLALHLASEVLRIAGVTLSCSDLTRGEWRKLLPAVNGIVFLVDCADYARLPESKTELDALMTDETIGNVPILILGNKIDKPEAISEEKLREIFGLYNQTTGK